MKLTDLKSGWRTMLFLYWRRAAGLISQTRTQQLLEAVLARFPWHPPLGPLSVSLPVSFCFFLQVSAGSLSFGWVVSVPGPSLSFLSEPSFIKYWKIIKHWSLQFLMLTPDTALIFWIEMPDCRPTVNQSFQMSIPKTALLNSLLNLASFQALLTSFMAMPLNWLFLTNT